MLKHQLHVTLYHLAKWVLERQQPTVIAVTGSVGKTSTKEAIYAVLKSKYSVRRTEGNYNNEIGLPLTVIGSTSGGRNPFKWLVIILKALAYSLWSLRYPKVLVLEMGADKPGDIKYLTSLAPAHIGILTTISDTPAHLENFKDVEQLANEKLIMLRHLGKDDIAIANLDEPFVVEALPKLKAKPFSISIKTEADLMAFDIDYAKDPMKLAYEPAVSGLRFKIRYQGSTVPVFIPGAVGLPIVYSALFAMACGLQMGMNLVDIIAALQTYQAPNGRLRLLQGKQHSVIIDDTYNSSPAAAREALTILHNMKTPGRRIAVLGMMAELGPATKRSHTALGKFLAELEIDLLVTVNKEAEVIAESAVANGFPTGMVFHYADANAAAANVPSILQPNDIILFKGSQISRLEKVVKACLEDRTMADEVLVRQYGKWKKS